MSVAEGTGDASRLCGELSIAARAPLPGEGGAMSGPPGHGFERERQVHGANTARPSEGAMARWEGEAMSVIGGIGGCKGDRRFMGPAKLATHAGALQWQQWQGCGGGRRPERVKATGSRPSPRPPWGASGSPFSRALHAQLAIDHRSSRVREALFCSAKSVPYPDRAELAALPNISRGQSQKDARDWRIAMKTILSALVALSVIAGVAGTASAFDAKSFYEQVDRNHN